MAMDARRGFSAHVLSTVSDTNAKDDCFQLVHSVTVDLPDEIVFFEAVGHMFLPSYTLQRCEEKHRDLTKVGTENFYEEFMDTIRLYQLEAPLQDDEFMVFKSTNHLIALCDFLKVVELNCENPRIVWIHNNTSDQLKSTIAVTKGLQKRYSLDIGVDDFAAFSKILVE